MQYTYTDGLECGGRRSRLYLAKGGEVKKFEGQTLDGWVAVVTAAYTKNGKWSKTTYNLELAPGVRPLYFLSPLHGLWGDSLDSWAAVAQNLGLPLDVAQSLVRTEYQRTADRLDQAEAFALAVESAGQDVETVIVSFGSPSARAVREGYWEEPKEGRASDGRRVVVVPGPQGWSEPEVVEPAEGCKGRLVQAPPWNEGW